MRHLITFHLRVLVLGILACSLYAVNTTPTASTATEKNSPKIKFVTSEEALEDSIHADLDCTDCHFDLERDDQGEVKLAGEVSCEDCHDDATDSMSASVHGPDALDGLDITVRCQDCHGAHDILEIDDPQSKLGKRKIARTCAPCHGSNRGQDHIFEAYLGDVHGKSLVLEGTVVSPSCLDCHGEAHTLLPADDSSSASHPHNVAELCGTCHLGMIPEYEASVHGQLVSDGEEGAPTCTTCHKAHGIVPTGDSFNHIADKTCGTCHEDRYEQYLQTYHGRVRSLGNAHVASCYDCHGSHNIGSDMIPNPIEGEQKIQTCRKCHINAPEGFASYLAHGDADDASNFPLLYWPAKATHALILAALAFLVLHTFGWNLRRRWLAHSGSMRRPSKRPFRMLRSIDRWCYQITVSGFVLLAISGLPLKFYGHAWAQMTFKILGGSEIAAGVHRIGASLVFIAILLHLVSLIAPLWLGRKQNKEEASRQPLLKALFGPKSPLPGWNDFLSLWHHLKWMLGKEEKPLVQGMLYWEKLDYLALVLGIAILAMTGLTMWVPEWVTLVFPGWILNIASIIHSNEALLALLLFFAIHITHYWNHRPVSNPRS